jgi:hypothetical protein
MSETNGAAAPTTEQAQPAQAGSEQANPEASVQEDAAPATAETEGKPEGAEPDTTSESEDGKPKRQSTSERYRRKISAQAGVIERMAAEIEQMKRSPASEAKTGDEKPPKEEDFNGDYFAFQRALTAFEVKQSLRSELDKDRQQHANERQNARRQEAAEEFMERADEVKVRIPDFEATIEAFEKGGGRFSQHVIEELQDSEHGPLLAYHLAKNPKIATELNAMSARDAAREIGRLEAKVSLPQPKKQTQAPAPLKTPTGGAAAPFDVNKAAQSEDVTELLKHWRKQKQSA